VQKTHFLADFQSPNKLLTNADISNIKCPKLFVLSKNIIGYLWQF